MTIRYPVVEGGTGKGVSYSTTYTFTGTKSGVTLTQVKLLRFTTQQIVDLYNNGKLEVSGSSTWVNKFTSTSSLNPYTINDDSTINGTSSGYIYVQTGDVNGDALSTKWKPWWPKETGRETFYDLNASGAASASLTFDRWPGNFTAVADDDYYNSTVSIQNCQESTVANREYVSWALYDKWLRSRGSDPLTGTSNIQGVELTTSGGSSLNTIYDTRYQASLTATSPSDYPVGTSNRPRLISIGYSAIGQMINSTDENMSAATAEATYYPTDGKLVPLYWDGSSLKRMSYTDLVDTFVKPALDFMVGAGNASNYSTSESIYPYTISTSSSLSGYYPGITVFTDTKVNINAWSYVAYGDYNGYYIYSNTNTTVSVDNPTTVSTYRLFTKNSLQLLSSISSSSPGYIGFDSNTNSLQPIDISSLLDMLYPIFKYHMVKSNKAIEYGLGTSTPSGARTLGTGLRDTATDPGVYKILANYVNTDDYRVITIPQGTYDYTQSTNYLYMSQTTR